MLLSMLTLKTNPSFQIHELLVCRNTRKDSVRTNPIWFWPRSDDPAESEHFAREAGGTQRVT